MNISKIFTKLMIPFLEENHFELTQYKQNDFYIFKHRNIDTIYIYFTIKTRGCGIATSLQRGSGRHNLVYFLFEPDKLELAPAEGYWYFDNEAEFVGVLEEQANLLKTKAFDWLLGSVNIDLDSLLKEIQINRAKRWESLTEEEREKLVSERRKLLQEWEQRRVKPISWHYE